MLKLLIVDNEPIIRNGIRGLIEWKKYGYDICGEAGDGPSAVEAILELEPDLVLLDLHLPGFSGLEIIKKFRQIQFLEIMEGIYKEELYGPFSFSGWYVQAAFVSVENMLMPVLRDFFQKDICHIFSYKEFMVCLFEDTPEAAVKRLLEDLGSYLEKYGVECAITLGSRYREESSCPGLGIQKTCREAEDLIEDIFFYQEKKYISLQDIQDKKSQDWDYDEEVRNLCSYIQVIDNEMIQSFFRKLKDIFYHSGKTPFTIRQECIELMIEVRNEMIKKFPVLKEKLGTGRETLGAIMKQRYLGMIIDTMTEACLHISGCLPLLSSDSSFQRIISYVNNNYNEELRLETLGQLFYYNCAYLGKRFKEYTGKNFHTYLDMLRIDAAKKMLQNTDMKVYEIAAAVGYANTDYFYSKFKKYTGESSLVFRRKV